MIPTRMTLVAIAVLTVAGCSSKSSNSPTAPSPTTTSSVQVTSATMSLIANAMASVGGPFGSDEQNETFDFLNETTTTEEVSAGAIDAGDGRSASAAATMGGICQATWDAPALLSSLDVEFQGGGEGSTAGTETVSTLAQGGMSGWMGLRFAVPAGGVSLKVETGDRVSVRIQDADRSSFDESQRDEGDATFFLPADEYLLVAETGGGVRFTDSPHSESDGLDTSVKLRFLAQTP